MDNELISKKELLELTGISYGQLYRWKRKNLIPEEWFIRKSTFTGQETFFPKQKILKRIDKILNMKDHLSLDEIAAHVSPNPAAITVETEQLLKQNIVSNVAVKLFEEAFGKKPILNFDELLTIFLIDQGLKNGSISLEEGRLLLHVMRDHYENVKGKNGELILIRKLGLQIAMIIGSPAELFIENEARIAYRANIAQSIEALKEKLEANNQEDGNENGKQS
mgnify:CR=1 FL=1